MPNWCSNTFTIRGKLETLKPIWDATQNEADVKFLDAMAPIGEWDYGTAVEAWGTKWDVNTEGMEFSDLGDGTAEITGFFDSAWSPPIAAFTTLCANDNDVYAELYYFEPGMAFVGYWDSEGADDHYDIDMDKEDMGIPAHLNEFFNVDSWYEVEEEEVSEE
jgi:hypothetical protein